MFLFSFPFCFTGNVSANGTAAEITPVEVRDGLSTAYVAAELNIDNQNVDKSRSPIDVIAATIKVALTIIPGIYIIYALYAGILWITSYGEAQKVKRARDILIHGSIGFAIVYLSGSVVAQILKYVAEAGSMPASG